MGSQIFSVQETKKKNIKQSNINCSNKVLKIIIRFLVFSSYVTNFKGKIGSS